MRDVLRVAADQHELSCGDPGCVFDSVRSLRFAVLVFDEAPALGGSRDELLDDPCALVVLNADQVLAFRRSIVPVDERFSALEEDDEEHGSGFPPAFHLQILPEHRSLIHVRNRLDMRLRTFDEGLQGFSILDLRRSQLGPYSRLREYDKCQSGKGRRCLEIQSHRILLYGVTDCMEK